MPRRKPSAVEPFTAPFTVLIDSAESQPWTFDGMMADADKQYRPLVVPRRYENLGRWPNSKGDYSLDGYQDRIGIERKAMEDVWGTVLGWPSDYDQKQGLCGRRERFEKELENLAKLEASIVIVEATLGQCLGLMPAYGVKSPQENQKIFYRSVLAYMQDYKVTWLFCDHRRMAEVAAYRWLARWFKHEQLRQKESA